MFFGYSFLLFFSIFIGCKQDENEPYDTSDYLTVTLQPENVNQTIHNFGASDAWSTQFLGKNWPNSKKEQIADWLFSTELDGDGNPKGIGLTAWRFNIGAGSIEQRSESNISDKWRRNEGFMTPEGDYNWDAHKGQRWFLEAASLRGVKQFIAFSNSPPVALTKNGKAYSSGGSYANLPPENQSLYASFLADVIDEIEKRDGISFNYISPFNEPQWDWDHPGQEGSPWRNSEIASVSRLLDKQLEEKGLRTEIEIPEAAQLNFLYESGSRAGRNNQIEDFFNPSSSNYLGDLSHIAKKVAGHSYFTTWNLDRLIEVREQLSAKVSNYPELEFWMTEYCPLEDNSEIKGNKRDLGMNLALYAARVIHTDLTVANASAWQWWLAVSPYDYKDGLVYIDFDENDGEIYDSKMLWTMGNYSRFIKSGFIRVRVSRSDLREISQNLGGLMVSGYIDPVNGKTVAVAINYSENEIPLNLEVKGKKNSEFMWYRTSSIPDEDLKLMGEYNSGKPMTMEPRSVVTFVEE
jgi:O-glycosyl hydrolase